MVSSLLDTGREQQSPAPESYVCLTHPSGVLLGNLCHLLCMLLVILLHLLRPSNIDRETLTFNVSVVYKNVQCQHFSSFDQAV